MIALSFLAALLGASTSNETLRFDPSAPRVGDLCLVYIKNEDAAVTQARLRVFGYEFPAFRVTEQELRAVIAIPLDTFPGEHDLEVLYGEQARYGQIQVFDRAFDRSELKVASQFTGKKSKQLLQRLASEEKSWDAVFKPEPGPPKFLGPLLRPVEGEVTGLFGTKRIFNGRTNSIHYGLDLDAKTGDPIKAAAGGRVVLSALRWASGGTIIIDHGGGLFTAYFHQSKRNKNAGDTVKAGEIIGLAGKTGRVTGPHLHLAVMVRAKYAGGFKMGQSRSLYVDPEPFLGLVF